MIIDDLSVNPSHPTFESVDKPPCPKKRYLVQIKLTD
jgi:hypothetical protein